MLRLLLRYSLAICWLVLTLPVNAHVFDTQGLLGAPIQVKLLPTYNGANLIGLEVYELFTDEEVGHSVVTKRSYYRFDTRRVIEDRDWYYVNGLASDVTLEVEHKYETQNWTITPELAASLDRAAQLVADPKAPVEELKELYRSLDRGVFKVRAGPVEREGKRAAKWLSGVQKVGRAEFSVGRSSRYGNRFTARFVD